MATASSLIAPILARSGAVARVAVAAGGLLIAAAASAAREADREGAGGLDAARPTAPCRSRARIVPPPEENRPADPADVAAGSRQGLDLDGRQARGRRHLARSRRARLRRPAHARLRRRRPAVRPEPARIPFHVSELPEGQQRRAGRALRRDARARARRARRSSTASTRRSSRRSCTSRPTAVAIPATAMVLHRLARLAMANEPRNVARNLARNTGKDGRIDPGAGRARPLARALPRGDLLPAGGRDLRDRAPAGHRPDRDPRLGRRRLRLRAVPPDELRRVRHRRRRRRPRESLRAGRRRRVVRALPRQLRLEAGHLARRSAARSSGTTTAPTPTSTPCSVSPIASTRAACSPRRNRSPKRPKRASCR